MKGIGIFTKTIGVGVQFGTENDGDPIDEPEIDLMVLDFDRSKTAVAVEMNYVLNGDIRLVANTAGAGRRGGAGFPVRSMDRGEGR